jgi:hypothetical protein
LREKERKEKEKEKEKNIFLPGNVQKVLQEKFGELLIFLSFLFKFLFWFSLFFSPNLKNKKITAKEKEFQIYFFPCFKKYFLLYFLFCFFVFERKREKTKRGKIDKR